MFKKIKHWFKDGGALNKRESDFEEVLDVANSVVNVIETAHVKCESCIKYVEQHISLMDEKIIPILEAFEKATQIDVEVSRPANRIEFESALSDLISAHEALFALVITNSGDSKSHQAAKEEVVRAKTKLVSMLFSHEMSGEEYIKESMDRIKEVKKG